MDEAEKSWNDAAATILQQAAAAENRPRVAQLLAGLLPQFLAPSVWQQWFTFWQARGIHVAPVHFYMPMPDTAKLPESLWETTSEMPGVDMDDASQLLLLRSVFPRFRAEYERFPLDPTDQPHEFYLNNPMFGGTDAMVSHCMVRHLKPRKIIEVGSGFSSRVSAQALVQNGQGELICIEPYPSQTLLNKFAGLSSVIAAKVQSIPVDFFEQLAAGDILFIDSSHVVQIGGDVNYLFLEVIPRLQPGVIVHVHDVFFPAEYRRDWVLKEFRFWTEQYLLQAFLAFNSQFKVLFSNQYMAKTHLADFKNTFANSPWWGGGSFWMQRRPH